MQRSVPYSLFSHLNVLIIFLSDWVDAQNHRGLDAFMFFFNHRKLFLLMR